MVVLTFLGCAGGPIEVTAIANEGFLIRSRRCAVLVDALFRATAPYPEFFQQGPSDELVQLMINGDGVFADIDVAFVSHAHGDHFHAETALAFLENHPETLLVGTDGVVAQMAVTAGFDAVSDRIVVPKVAGGDSCEHIEWGGVKASVCVARHSGGGEIFNNIAIVEMDGFRFLHEGDAERSSTTFASLELPEEGLDLAFLHDWFVLNAGREVLTEIVQPRAVVLMHHRWERAEETRERVNQLPDAVASALPPVTVFGAEGESIVFKTAKGKAAG
jgi:L-ascorbate metabolism protein UlaG (beta-lactamase superfamily)